MENQTNRNDSNPGQDNSGHKKKKVSALEAASLGRSATSQVDPHSNSGLANTGTNISYEGPTAPGAGGSVGSGYASGKEAADERISTNSDYTQNRAEKVNNQNEEEDVEDEDFEDEDFDEEDDVDDEDFDEDIEEGDEDDLEEDEMR